MSVVYSLREDGIKFSVRSELEEIDAGKVIACALKGVGNGGGHKGMAGGFIPKGAIPELGENMDENIHMRFLKQKEIQLKADN